MGIPSLLSVLFGSANQYNPPSILFNPDTVYFRIVGTPFNGIYMTTVGDSPSVILVALVALMRFTNLGLQMRGAVESRRLIELDGVNAGRVVATAWMISGPHGRAGRRAPRPRSTASSSSAITPP